MGGSYLIGLDLGQAADYSALIVAEQVRTRYEVRAITRWDLGTPYPRIVADVAALTRSPGIRHELWQLIVDGTGVGRPIVDLLAQAGLNPRGVLITAGAQASYDEWGYTRVPKRELVSTMQLLLQSDRLKIARRLPASAILVQELLNFDCAITDAGHDSYGAWRQGTHDDLVLALALACWFGERMGTPGV